jgi:putative MATE family efflux protein
LPLILGLTAPNTSAFVVQSLVILTEVWMIGQLGTQALAAMALVFPFLILIQTMSGGALGGAISSAVARTLGSGEPELASRLIWHALYCCWAGALVFLGVYWLIGETFLQFLGGGGEVLRLALMYSDLLFLGGVVIWMSSGLSAVFRGMGMMGFSASTMLIGSCLQVPLSAGLILGWFGLPQLGLTGAVLSTLIVSSLMTLVFLVKLAGRAAMVRLSLKLKQFDASLMERIMMVARPASLSPLMTVATILGLTALVGRSGDVALAGYGIGTRVEFLMTPIVFSIGTALTTVVGTSMGAGKVDRAERAGWVGAGLAAAIGGLIGVTLALIPGVWIPLFTDDLATQARTQIYIQWVGPCYVFLAVGLVLYFASQGAGRMRWPITATLTRFAVAMGLSLFLLSQGGGYREVVIAAASGMTLYGLMIVIALWRGAWR